MEQKRILTTGDIAKYCGVHFRTVIRWVERGQLKAYKLPGRGDNRVQLQDFLAFLKAHKMPIPTEFQGSARRVLVVEDDSRMANAIRRTLRRAGFEVMIAPNGFKAGALLGTFTPSVITLDLQMPGLSGFDVLSFVRQMPNLADLRVLVVSAMPRKELEAALAAGADDVLDKPFKNEALVEKVSRLAQIEV